jgi:hypothetical protein
VKKGINNMEKIGKIEKVDLEKRSVELEELLKKAKENPIDEKDYLAFEEGVGLIVSKKIQTDEFLKRYSYLYYILKNSVIKVTTLSELKLLLERANPEDKEWQIKTLEHENAHANKAAELGVTDISYSLIAIKADNEISLTPFTDSFLPPEWNDEKKLEVSMKILKAPDEYGDKMSSYDNEKFEKLKNRTKE